MAGRYGEYRSNIKRVNELAVEFVLDRISKLPPNKIQEQAAVEHADLLQIRERLVQEMKQEFKFSTEYLKCKRKFRGDFDQGVAEMSSRQFIKLQRDVANNDVNDIKNLTGRIIKVLAKRLACFLFMMKKNDDDQWNERFQQLWLACSFMASMEDGADIEDSTSGIGVAYWMFLPFFPVFEEAMKNEQPSIAVQEEIAPEEIDQFFKQFETIMSTMDMYLSLPSMYEDMLASVADEFRGLVKQTVNFQVSVIEMKARITSQDQSSMEAIYKFVEEFNTSEIEQRCEDFLNSDGQTESAWLQLKFEKEEASFKHAEHLLEQFRQRFVVAVKRVLNTNRFRDTTNLALAFGKFYVGEKASIKALQSMDRASLVRNRFITRIRYYPEIAADRDYLVLAKDMEGFNATFSKKNVIQLLKQEEHRKPELEVLAEYAVYLGNRMSRSLSKFMVLMMLSGEEEWILNINKLKDTFRFLRRLYFDSGPAAFADNNFVYHKVIEVMDKTEMELRNAQGADPQIVVTNWAPVTENEMHTLLHNFAYAFATMETLMSLPMMLPTANKPVLQNIDRTHLEEVDSILCDVVHREAREGEEEEIVDFGAEECVKRMEGIFTDQHMDNVINVMNQVMERLKEYIDAEWKRLGERE